MVAGTVTTERSLAASKGLAVSGPTAPRYVEPDWFTAKVFNPLVNRLTRWGISLKGSRVLEVRGRTIR